MPSTHAIRLEYGKRCKRALLTIGAGLRTLLIAAKELGKDRRRLALAGLNPCVCEVFQISRVDKMIPTFERVDEALGSISPRALGAFNARPPAPRRDR